VGLSQTLNAELSHLSFARAAQDLLAFEDWNGAVLSGFRGLASEKGSGVSRTTMV